MQSNDCLDRDLVIRLGVSILARIPCLFFLIDEIIGQIKTVTRSREASVIGILSATLLAEDCGKRENNWRRKKKRFRLKNEVGFLRVKAWEIW